MAVAAGVQAPQNAAAASSSLLAPSADGVTVAAAERGAALGDDWRSSADRVLTTVEDIDGLHLLVASRRDGYTWRTAATLRDPLIDTDQWIGNACVTASGRRAVAVFAPRQAVNHEDAFHAGGTAAIVDLDNGAITRLPDGVSLAYYNPGCGAAEQATFTANRLVNGRYVSRLITVDTVTATVTDRVDVAGQITSAVPDGDDIVAARGTELVSVDKSAHTRVLTDNQAVPFRLGADREGGIAYEVQDRDEVHLHRFGRQGHQVIATARAKSVRLHAIAGTIHVDGPGASALGLSLPSTWRAHTVPVDAEPSTGGLAAVTNATNGIDGGGEVAMNRLGDRYRPIRVGVTLLDNGRHYGATLLSAAPTTGGRVTDSALTPSASALPAAIPPGNDTTDPDRACAIPRNDPKIQSLQPSPAMGEWAADLAVQGALTTTRPAGWNGSTLGTYTPQGLFPSRPLLGGGQVPAQIMLGVLAQESNMWQASPHAVDGESGNFEQGGFYGRTNGATTVDFGHADCGYGAAQVTTGMRKGDTVYTSAQQTAIAVDYAANISAGLQILQDKWNQTKQAGMIVNNGDPQYLENWWYALWAYNSGYHKRNDPTDPNSKPDVYGLGWSNNVTNEDYPADRGGFLDQTTPCTPEQQDPNGNCSDAKHPNSWSYPERVIGWARHSLLRYNYVDGKYQEAFARATWAHGPQIPRPGSFCTVTGNQCDITKIHKPANYPTDPGSHCQRDDLACYWHDSASWQDNYPELGTQVLKYLPGDPEPAANRLYAPACGLAPLPGNALIIDDVPADTGTHGCTRNWTNQGNLSFNFAANSGGRYPSKIDFHQLGTGFAGHFWFAHTWTDSTANAIHRVTGTWTLNRALDGWARVLVYIPEHGAEAPKATYRIGGSDSTSPTRTITEGNYLDGDRKPQPGSWHSLGSFHFTGTPSVSLTNTTDSLTANTDGALDVAWDAIAFQPLPGPPPNQVVALGDSFSGGEGAVAHSDDYDRASNHTTKDTAQFDACHRSPNAWSRLAALPGSTTPIGARSDTFDPAVEYHLSACSYAHTWDMHGSGIWQEGGQLDQGYLDQHTTLVTLSLGGNDARFSEILEFCVQAHQTQGIDCPAATYPRDSKPLSQAEPELIRTTVMPAVAQTLDVIHAAAPKAKIILMGYPVLMQPGAIPCVTAFSAGTVDWFGDMARELDQDFAAMVAAERQNNVPVTYVSSISAFSGHAACSSSAFIHGIEIGRARAEIPSPPLSQQSFHPNVDGARTFANLLTAALRTN